MRRSTEDILRTIARNERAAVFEFIKISSRRTTDEDELFEILGTSLALKYGGSRRPL